MNEKTQVLSGHELKGGAGSRLYVDGKRYLNFGGCNYLALTDRPELRKAAYDALENGCVFSRFLVSDYGGNDPSFDRVEEQAARFYGTQSALYLPSGFHLGFAAMAGLKPWFDVVVLDRQSHWCLSQAASLSGVPVEWFEHCDADSLEQTLGNLPAGQRPLIATDGAFATTGELPPLDRYAELVNHYDGQILVDESHAAGVVGETGRGAIEHFGLQNRVHAATTLSKAFCGQGAIITGTSEMIQRAGQAPAVRGSNPGSPISAEVSAAALKLVHTNPGLCADVRARTAHLRAGLRAIGLDISESPAPIVSFCRGSFDDMRAIQTALFEDGIYVLHSNYIAAGPSGTIRIAVFADHEYDDLDRLIERIKPLIPSQLSNTAAHCA